MPALPLPFALRLRLRPLRLARLLGLLSLLSLALLPAATAGGTSWCGPVNRSARTLSLGRLRRTLLCLVNLERVVQHLPALREDSRLHRSAQRWTFAMVANRSFGHGGDFSARIAAQGFRWKVAGENIATGMLTPLHAVRSWMASPEHCRNILDPRFAEVGTGVIDRPTGGLRHGATWTQDFALRIHQHVPSGNWRPYARCPV